MRHLPSSLFVWALPLVSAAIAAGCGETIISSNATGTASGTSSSSGAGGASSGTASASSSSGAGGSIGGDCQALADAIAQQAGGVHTCTALVRLGYTTKAIFGYLLSCAPYGAVDEATAGAIAENDTGYGANAQLLSGPQPADEWVFWMPAGDFGGSGVVNARNGKTVFGGSTVWGGGGDFTYPHPFAFDPPSAIGSGCSTSAPKPTARGFDLGSGMPLSQAEVSAAVDVVWSTALPDGLWKNSYVFDAMVLLYPRSVGGFDPDTAEWVVLVNSGWLD